MFLNSIFVTLATSQLDILVQFYTNLIGIEPESYIPQIYAEFRLNNLRLGIFQPKEANRQEFDNSGRNPISLCFEVSVLESAIAHITALGYPPPGKIINASHGREIYAYDPDGNRIIFYQSNKLD
ncbi:Glyoxalase/bleomycin resistance protein/dioxygenase [Crinalium epipsammum PCC 9333]|uniref:Glyoxalase/bleomycin resistance protein/dioxygenase n=1 Tax=Crinalium epipsammum PCC 9333 TaxID=1173022 RepID=K9W1P8_9CYAN|nr:VOC family protein [Crinalium epipsammum]AFZ13355.1 Glyoxalase/bleomycin resistance protein/dioxygenase [Crinalium epipsammum PCC 9333]